MYGPLLTNLVMVLMFVGAIVAVVLAFWLIRPYAVRAWRSYYDANADAGEQTHDIWEKRRK